MEEEKNILVSVSCTSYNQKKYIRRMLESIVNQKTDFAFEVLAGDDASDDGTQDIIREFAESYPGIVLPFFPEENQYRKGNTKTNFTFNYGRARGKYIAHCEGDDYWTDPEKLQKQVRDMEAHPECAMCFHAIRDVTEAGELIAEYHPYPESRLVSMQEALEMTRVFPFVSYMIRAEYAKELPEYYFTCPIGDVPLVLAMAEKGSLYYRDEVMAAYRNAAQGSWNSAVWKKDEEKAGRLKRHLELMKDTYRKFDEGTGHRYHETVEKVLMEQDFQYVRGIEDFKGMLEPGYREAFEKMPFSARLGARLGAVSPALFHALQKLAGRR